MGLERLGFKSILLICQDETTIENLKPQLKETFKTVFYESDATQGFEKFFGEQRSDDEIDLVLFDVTDSNTPVLQKIREKTKRIPIFTVASDYANLDALSILQQKIYYAFTKPIDFEHFKTEVYAAIKEVAKRKFSAYSHKVAVVTRTNLDGNFIYANELFYEITGYTKEELLGQHHTLIRHPNTPQSLLDEMKGTLKEGKIWHGITKNITKEEEDFSTNATIFPIFNSNNETIEYLSISFIVTKEEQNISKLKRYIMDQKSAQIQQNKKLDKKINDRIEVAIKNERYKYEELKKVLYELETDLLKSKSTKNTLAHQVIQLEGALKKVKDKEESADTTLKEKLRAVMNENYEVYKKNEKLEKNYAKLEEKLEKSQESIKIFQGYIDDYRDKIKNLEEIIEMNKKK